VNSDKAASPVDQSKLTADENALTNAENNQASGTMKDQQQVQQAQLALQSAQLSVQNAQAAVAVKQAPPQPGTLDQAKAQVVQAQTSLAAAQKTLSETTLTSPAAGTIATVGGSVGDTVAGGGASGSASSSTGSSSGSGSASGTGAAAAASTSSSSSSSASSSAFITLTNLDTLQVTAGFSESDAVKVKLGQPAAVTFSALPNVTANAKVVAIALTSTVVSNVVTYNVTVDFDGRVGSVKPGMTASVAVTTAEASNVLTLPASAVPTSGTTGTVQVQQANGKTATRTIGIGLRGDNAVEITSGLSAGDKVVTTVASVASGTGTGTGTGTGFGGGARFGGGGFGGLGSGIGR
jgi:multidrug efflux pump subunit AcrA (membrane-fusion protein)